jgi:hypothetical protein
MSVITDREFADAARRIGALPRRRPWHHVAVPSPATAQKEVQVADEYQKLTREELDQLAGEPLPERAAMSLINANVAAPINLAVALNVASDNSVAYANAEQTAPITQTI